MLFLKHQESQLGAQLGNASVVAVLVRFPSSSDRQNIEMHLSQGSGGIPQARAIARIRKCICRGGSARLLMNQHAPGIGKSICRGGSGAFYHLGASRRVALRNLPNPKVKVDVPAATFFLSIL